jgi:hypothetical protein
MVSCFDLGSMCMLECYVTTRDDEEDLITLKREFEKKCNPTHANSFLCDDSTCDTKV